MRKIRKHLQKLVNIFAERYLRDRHKIGIKSSGSSRNYRNKSPDSSFESLIFPFEMLNGEFRCRRRHERRNACGNMRNWRIPINCQVSKHRANGMRCFQWKYLPRKRLVVIHRTSFGNVLARIWSVYTCKLNHKSRNQWEHRLGIVNYTNSILS